MQQTMSGVLAVVMSLGIASWASAENPPTPASPSTMQQVQTQASQMATTAVEKVTEIGQEAKAKAGQMVDKVVEKADAVKQHAQATLSEAATAVEKSKDAKDITAGLLQWIYKLAGFLSFSGFYWLAFALMVAGVVSWTGQLVIAKLVVASEGGFSITEIISDATVLAISLFGLVLTTQAAAQNSSFTQSSVMVLSSAAVGIVFGIMLYVWGQAQEMEAAQARGSNARKGRK